MTGIKDPHTPITRITAAKKGDRPGTLTDSSPANPRCVIEEHEKRAFRHSSLARRLSPCGGLKSFMVQMQVICPAVP